MEAEEEAEEEEAEEEAEEDYAGVFSIPQKQKTEAFQRTSTGVAI